MEATLRRKKFPYDLRLYILVCETCKQGNSEEKENRKCKDDIQDTCTYGRRMEGRKVGICEKNGGRKEGKAI